MLNSQEFPGSYSQAVSASDAEAVIDRIVSAHLASLQQTTVPRSRKGYAVHECRKCLASDGHVNPRRLIALALLLCPGEPGVKTEKLLMIVPPEHEVCLHARLCTPQFTHALQMIYAYNGPASCGMCCRVSCFPRQTFSNSTTTMAQLHPKSTCASISVEFSICKLIRLLLLYEPLCPWCN